MPRLLLLLAFPLAILTTAACGSSKTATTTVVPDAKTVARTERPDATDRRARAAARMETTISRLQLSDKQEQQFRAINKKYADQSRQLREANGGDRRAGMQQLRDLLAARNREVNGILDDNQRKIYAEIQEENRAEMQRRRGERGGGRGRFGG